MVKRMYLYFCLVCFQLLSWAGVVTGTVRDAETGEELIGAVLTTENGTGTATDADGRYTLHLPKGVHTLTEPFTSAVFSNVTFIGPMGRDGFENTPDYINGGKVFPQNVDY